MLFSEIYSAYYNTVASIISCRQQGKLDSDLLFKIVKESAFPESFMTIGSALENGKWPLIKKDYIPNSFASAFRNARRACNSCALRNSRLSQFTTDRSIHSSEAFIPNSAFRIPNLKFRIPHC